MDIENNKESHTPPIHTGEDSEDTILNQGAPGIKSKQHPDIGQQLNRIPLAALGVFLLLVIGFAAWGYLGPKGIISMGGQTDTVQKPQPAKAPEMASPPDGISIPAANPEVKNSLETQTMPTSNTPVATATMANQQPDYQAQERMQFEMQQRQEAAQQRQEALQQEQARQARMLAIRQADSTVYSGNSGNAPGYTTTNPTASVTSDLQKQIQETENEIRNLMAGGSSGSGVKPASNSLQAQVTTSGVSSYLPHTRMPAISPYEVKAGAVIPSVMLSGINSDLPGQIIAQVVQNVYDSATGKFLLIPQGAKLVGTYDHGIVLGQQRVLISWNRIIYPDSSSVDIEAMAGQDQSGYAGFKDKVNNHTWPAIKQAVLLSAISAGAQLSQPRAQRGDYSYSAPQIGAAAMGQQLNQLGMLSYQSRSNLQPTITIRPGYRFNVMVNKDMILAPWQNASAPYQKAVYQTASRR